MPAKSFAYLLLAGRPQFGSVTVWGWNGSSGSGFPFWQMGCETEFEKNSCNTYTRHQGTWWAPAVKSSMVVEDTVENRGLYRCFWFGAYFQRVLDTVAPQSRGGASQVLYNGVVQNSYNLDGRNRAIVIAQSLARLFAAIRLTSLRWRSFGDPQHRRWSLETLRSLRCDSHCAIRVHSCNTHE